ncbi:MAG: TonB-dependent receptor [Candidatus Poribacteria bacterium]|nr:TonB-dependent receptor [Candidatus Poribacteria bacterium]
MLGTRAFQHRLFPVGVLSKCTYLFAALLISHLFWNTSHAQSEQVMTRSLRGEVIDARSRTRLEEVVVHIAGLEKRVRTDTNGQFQFDAVPEGQYKLQFAKTDYQQLEQMVDVNSSTPYIQIELKTVAYHLKTIRVRDAKGDLSKFEKTTDLALEDAEFQRKLGMTLADTLSDEAGISQRTMGKAAARPVIRGLGGDRLLILENGERTGDKSASSADHAVSIDPTTAEGVEITRGPGALIYGSSTLGGVVNVKRNNIPQTLPIGTDTDLTFQGESVNSGWIAATGFVTSFGPFAAQVKLNRRRASDTQTPIGTLKNTSLSNVNISTGTSFIKDWGYIGISTGDYRSDYGIPGSPEGHITGVNIALDRQRYAAEMEYRFNRPGLDKVKLQGTYTSYQHQELESNGTLGVEFGVLTYNFSAMAHVLDNAIMGVWGEYRDHATGGVYWTPHTREFALAGFYLNERDFDRFTLQGAIRYDIRRAEPFRDDSPVIRAGTVQRRDFNGVSGAASGIYRWTDSLSTGATLMKTFRAPGIEELFSDGPHLAAYSYEIGNAQLKAEHGYGTEVFGRYTIGKLNLNLAIFQNRILGYLIPTNTGQKEWGSGAAGWLWIYQYTGQDVVMNGAEIQIGGEVLSDFRLQLNMSYVDGTVEANGKPLERIPPLSGKVAFSYAPWPFHFHVTSRFSGSQTRLGEFEQPTDGYLVHDVGAYLSLWWKQLENTVVFEIENLFDTAYREHLSLIKAVMPEPGRNVKLLYKLYF